MKVLRFGCNVPVEHNLEQIEAWIAARCEAPCKLLFIGVDWDRKGGELALEAARILNSRGIPTVLQVVGCTAPPESFVENYGFISKSTAEGRATLRALYAAATCFIIPTRAEASAIVFCEASAYGLPAFTTQTGGVGDYVESGETGYCLPLAAPGMAYVDLIQSTLSDLEEYRRLSMNAYSRFRTLLNWESSVSTLVQMLSDAISNER